MKFALKDNVEIYMTSKFFFIAVVYNIGTGFGFSPTYDSNSS